MPSLVSCVATALAIAGGAAARSYTLTKTYDASNFFDEFDFQTVRDVPARMLSRIEI